MCFLNLMEQEFAATDRPQHVDLYNLPMLITGATTAVKKQMSVQRLFTARMSS